MDRYWGSMLHIFTENRKLQSYVGPEFVDMEAGEVNIAKLKRIARPWSNSERFMLNLALHLFNPRNKVELDGMDSLDAANTRIALEAIRMRYS